MMKILNLTPHNINIIAGANFKPEIRKATAPASVAPVFTFVPAGVLAQAKVEVVEETMIEDVIPVRTQTLRKQQIQTDLSDIDAIIVSVMYASAGGNVLDIHGNIFYGEVLTTGDVVVDELDHQRIIGCTCLVRNK